MIQLKITHIDKETAAIIKFIVKSKGGIVETEKSDAIKRIIRHKESFTNDLKKNGYFNLSSNGQREIMSALKDISMLTNYNNKAITHRNTKNLLYVICGDYVVLFKLTKRLMDVYYFVPLKKISISFQK